MIAVVSTVAPHKLAEGPAYLTNWLEGFESLRESVDEPVTAFCAIETWAYGLVPFAGLVWRLDQLGGAHCEFALRDPRPLTTNTRLTRICTGRNLCMDWALWEAKADWILFLDSDLLLHRPAVALPRLLEMGYPVCGGRVPGYGLSGPKIGGYSFEVQEHWNTAGFLLVRRDVARMVRWRLDADAGQSDDPAFDTDCRRLGYPTWVRQDVIGQHPPLIAFEDRPRPKEPLWTPGSA